MELSKQYVDKISDLTPVDVIENLKSILTEKSIEIFAIIDHSKAAEKVGLKLNTEAVIIFGDPKVGTSLMQENPAIGIELPLKILVSVDSKGMTHLGYQDPLCLKDIYGISKNSEVLKRMSEGLAKITNEASKRISKFHREVSQNELIGSWRVIGCQLNTQWLPTPIFENFIYQFPSENEFKLLGGDLSYPRYVGGFPKSSGGKISINNNTIDLTPDEGPYAGQTFKGIYELDHEILKANFAFPGNERPSSFSAQQGQVYEIWQKVQ